MMCLLVILSPYLSIISSTPIPAADPFTGLEMMTTGYMMTAAGSMMAAALLAKGIDPDNGLTDFSHSFIGFLLFVQTSMLTTPSMDSDYYRNLFNLIDRLV